MENKQEEYKRTRRVYTLRLGIEQAIHGVNHVLTYSATELWDHDERWQQIQIQANRSLAELLVLRTNLDLLIDAENRSVEENQQNVPSDVGSDMESPPT